MSTIDTTKTITPKDREKKEHKEEKEEAALKANHPMAAWANGTIMRFPFEMEEPSDKDKKMHSLAVMKVDDTNLYSPVKGVIKKVEPDQNVVVIEAGKGLAVAVKACKSAVTFGKDAKVLVGEGQDVEAGTPMVDFGSQKQLKSKLLLVKPHHIQVLKDAGYHSVAKEGTVTKGEIIIEK